MCVCVFGVWCVSVGTQAERGKDNKILLLKVSEISRTKHDDSEDDEEDEEEDGDDKSTDDVRPPALPPFPLPPTSFLFLSLLFVVAGCFTCDEMCCDVVWCGVGWVQDPILQSASIDCDGEVNRIRCMPQQSNFLASWHSTGKVHIWNASKQLAALDKEGPQSTKKIPTAPIFTFQHSTPAPAPLSGGRLYGNLCMLCALMLWRVVVLWCTPLTAFEEKVAGKGSSKSGAGRVVQKPIEGFALDWCGTSAGRLASGDHKAGLYVWEFKESTWIVNPVCGHPSPSALCFFACRSLFALFCAVAVQRTHRFGRRHSVVAQRTQRMLCCAVPCRAVCMLWCSLLCCAVLCVVVWCDVV
jgi:hypothetical protein